MHSYFKTLGKYNYIVYQVPNKYKYANCSAEKKGKKRKKKESIGPTLPR